jgi:hypothetical protein
MTYLFNETSEEFDDPLESLNSECRVGAEYTEHVDKLVVHCIVLGSKLAEEHAGHVRNLLVAILKALGHLAQLALDLDLTSQDQERQRHEACALDTWIAIIETAVEEVGVLIDEMVETYSHVAKSNNEIAAYNSILTPLKNGEQES